MRRLSALPLGVSLLLLSAPMFASVHAHHRGTSHALVRRNTATHMSRAGHFAERAGSGGISSERATEIQAALIERGYLTGEPTGSWDSTSIAAMEKMQSDNGWQTKLVPDSRALIKLGLGPGKAQSLSTPASGSTAAASIPPVPIS